MRCILDRTTSPANTQCRNNVTPTSPGQHRIMFGFFFLYPYDFFFQLGVRYFAVSAKGDNLFDFPICFIAR